MPDDAKCSKCKAPLDTEGSPKWCKACRAEYQRDNRAGAEERFEKRGFAAGVSANRDYLAAKFAGLPPHVNFTGREAAHWVRTSPGPQMPE